MMESGETNAAPQEPPAEIGPLAVVAFEVATARRVGVQLRHARGPQLDEIRRAVRVLTHADPRESLTQCINPLY